MKKFLLIAFLILYSYLHGQNNFMALSFGGNLPLQDFGLYSDLSHNGFALSGFTGDYSGAYFLKNKLGIGGNIRYASHSTDEDAIRELLTDEIPDNFTPSNEPSYLISFWKYISVLAGPEYTILREHANIDFFLLTGINFVLPPEMSIYVSDYDNYYERKLEINTVNLGLEAGFALRYHLNAYSSIRLHASWFVSTCKGKIIKEMVIQDSVTSDKFEYNCPINALNAGIGIAYRL